MVSDMADASPRTKSRKRAQATPEQTVGERRARELERSARQALRELATWWQTSARDLPWRYGRTTPWGVLVCEVMSQQTQMSRVVPYWEAWMSQWPDAASLAAAEKSEVIRAWGRLGYPRRALRLQECAEVVARDYDDRLPREYDELMALPSVGDYTARAAPTGRCAAAFCRPCARCRRAVRSRMRRPRDCVRTPCSSTAASHHWTTTASLRFCPATRCVCRRSVSEPYGMSSIVTGCR